MSTIADRCGHFGCNFGCVDDIIDKEQETEDEEE